MIVISWLSEFPFYLFVCLLFSFSFCSLFSPCIWLPLLSCIYFAPINFLYSSLYASLLHLSLHLLFNSTILLFSSTLPLIFPEPSFCLPPFFIPHTPVTPYSYSFLILFFSYSSSSFHPPPPLSCFPVLAPSPPPSVTLVLLSDLLRCF